MFRSKSLILLLLVIVVISCSDDDDFSPANENELATVEEIKAALNNAINDNVLITGTEEQLINGLPYTVIAFENNDSIYFRNSLITSIEEETSNWNISIDFSDNTSLDAGLIGDTLYLNSLELDPFDLAPLSALAILEMPVDGKFEVEVMGKGQDGITINKRFDRFDTEHQLPILGLYQDFANQVKITFLSADNVERFSNTYTIQTESLNNLPVLDIIENNLGPDENQIYFVSNLSMGFDQKGEIRWSFSGNGAHLYRKLANGNLIIASSEDMILYHSRTFYELSMLGEIVEEYDIPNYLHHEIRELPNGNFLVGANSAPFVVNDGIPEEDYVVEVDRTSGAITRSWDLNLILDPNRIPIPAARPDDWFHLNALYYDESDNSIVVSGRSQSCVAKFDYETGDLKWILANPNFWDPQFSNALLQPVDSNNMPIDASQLDFWTSGQHAPLKLPNGNILVYDNGIYRGFYYDQNVEQNSYTRVVEYRVDEDNNTIELVSEFTYNDINTISTGDVDYIDETEGYLIGFMNRTSNSTTTDTPKILELSSNKEIRFEANIDVGVAPRNYYRAERMHLYDGLE